MTSKGNGNRKNHSRARIYPAVEITVGWLKSQKATPLELQLFWEGLKSVVEYYCITFRKRRIAILDNPDYCSDLVLTRSINYEAVETPKDVIKRIHERMEEL